MVSDVGVAMTLGWIYGKVMLKYTKSGMTMDELEKKMGCDPSILFRATLIPEDIGRIDLETIVRFALAMGVDIMRLESEYAE